MFFTKKNYVKPLLNIQHHSGKFHQGISSHGQLTQHHWKQANNSLQFQSIFRQNKSKWHQNPLILNKTHFFNTNSLIEHTLGYLNPEGKYLLPNNHSENRLTLTEDDCNAIKKSLTTIQNPKDFNLDISDFTMTESRIICMIIELCDEYHIPKIKVANSQLNHENSHHIFLIAQMRNISLDFTPSSSNDKAIIPEWYQMRP